MPGGLLDLFFSVRANCRSAGNWQAAPQRDVASLPGGEVLPGRHGIKPLEHAGEMLRILEAQQLGRLRHSVPAHQQVAGPLHDEAPNGVTGRVAGELADEVAEIIGRQKEFLRAIFHGGQAMNLIGSLVVITGEQVLEAREQVTAGLRRHGQLLRVKARDVFQNELDISHHDVACALIGPGEFLADVLHQPHDDVPLLLGHEQGLVCVIGEKGVGMHALFEVAALQEFGVEEQRPALRADFLAGIGLATYLAGGHTHQGMPVKVVLCEPVGQVLKRLIANENGIHVVIVERMPAMLQLVVMDDRDKRMQLRSPDVAGIVIDAMNLQDFLHTTKLRISERKAKLV